jgi:hypothetical protein
MIQRSPYRVPGPVPPEPPVPRDRLRIHRGHVGVVLQIALLVALVIRVVLHVRLFAPVSLASILSFLFIQQHEHETGERWPFRWRARRDKGN